MNSRGEKNRFTFVMHDFFVKNSTKKIISLFFILLGFTPVLLFLSFDIKQNLIRHGMKAKLQYQQLQKIVIPEDEVIWIDEHEIRVNDCMFDIHSSSLDNGVYIFTGLYDEEETRLIEQRNETSGKNKEENKLLSQLLNWLQSTYKNNEDQVVLFKYYSKEFNSFKTSSLINLFTEIPSPPPRNCMPYYGSVS